MKTVAFIFLLFLGIDLIVLGISVRTAYRIRWGLYDGLRSGGPKDPADSTAETN